MGQARNADMPAIPSGIQEDYNNLAQEPLNLGLTKREQFAAMAMQGLLSGVPADGIISYDEVADDARRCADALLAELEKERTS